MPLSVLPRLGPDDFARALSGRDELFRAYEMITTNPLRASGRDWSIAEGQPANFVVLECEDEVEAIRLRPTARWVVRNGNVVAETEPSRTTVLAPGFEGEVTFRRDTDSG